MSSSQSSNSSDFIQLLENNKGILYKVSRIYCSSREEQKDLIQEMSLQAWRSFSNFNPSYKFSTWLYKISLNVAISHLRKESKRKEFSQPIQKDQFMISEQNEAYFEEHINQLYQIISEFKAFDRALLLLFLEEKSYQEISEVLGISQTNVSTKLSRLKKLIKEKFERQNQH